MSDLLRHTLATLAYRGGKAVRNVPSGFSGFRAAPGSRSAGEILAHVCDLLDWAVSTVRGAQRWQDTPPRDWNLDVARFFEALATLDTALTSGMAPGVSEQQIFQGPIADALTHVGQIALLRRLAGAPVRGENYLKAEIVTGRIGPSQAAPVYEFD